MKKVWVNRTFDVLHIGHIRLINFAKSFGIVRIGLDTDNRVSEKKGIGRPFNTLENRMEFISAINGVHSVVSFGTDEELRNCIREWGPDVFVIGNDYIDKPIVGGGLAKEIKFFEKVDGISTSKILGDEETL